MISVHAKSLQSCSTLYDPMDGSLPGSSVHWIFQARVLEWVAIPFSRRSSWPRDRTLVSSVAGRFFTTWATREAPGLHKIYINNYNAMKRLIKNWGLLRDEWESDIISKYFISLYKSRVYRTVSDDSERKRTSKYKHEKIEHEPRILKIPRN